MKLRSLRVEGAVLLCGLVLVAGIIYAYAALSALRESGARTRSEMLDEAGALAQRFDGVFQLGRERLSAVAEQPGLALWLGGRHEPARGAIPQSETLHYLFFHSDIFTGPVALVDRDGALLWTEPYDAERVDAHVRVDPALFARKIGPRPLPWRQGPAVLLAQPIVDLSGRTVGALLGEIDLASSRLAGFLHEPRLGSAALLDEEGAPLLASPGARPPPRELPAFGTVSSSEGLLLARAVLQEAPWSTLVAEEDKVALASQHRLTGELILVGLLLAVAAVLLAVIAAGRIVRPIEVLTLAASAVPRGDFSQPIPERAPGELNDLSQAFLAMRRDLESTLRGLRESEERYRRSIDSANDAIFALEPGTLRVLHGNLSAARICPGAQVFSEICAPEQREAAAQFLARVAASGKGALPELDLICNAETRLPVSVSASVIEHGGGRFLQLICSDLTERKKIERELVQAEKMSTVGMLAAGILHELNNPLTYTLGNLQEAQREIALLPGASETLKGEIDDALLGAERATLIARDLRIFARTQESQSQCFDVNDALRMALRMSQHELKYKAQVESQLGEVPPVLGQLTEVSQVFLNLIVNAAHAIAPGDPARQRVRVSTCVEGPSAVVRIADTGSGIPPEVLPRIFDAFFTTKPEGVGTGLGLAISKEIVQRSGGRISVESERGKGTTFTVELRLA